MRRDMMTARFKRDYVAFMAVALFFVIVCLEIGVAVWIPMQMHNESLFVVAMRRIKMNDRFDVYRRELEKVRKDAPSPELANEAQMILNQLEILAIYLQQNDRGRRLGEENIEPLEGALNELAPHVRRIRHEGKSVSNPLKLDRTKYIRKIAEDEL